MKILELQIKNFGCCQDKTIRFQDGINVIYGDNESGKTTIHTFIKAMLFGLERGKGRASVNDTFSQYEPWENPNYYAGRMRFQCGERIFCLDRSFDKYGKKASLICENDGEVLSVEHGDLDILLGGMNQAAFENTASIGQLNVETGPELTTELKNYAANYYLTGNGDLNLEAALEYLTEKRRTAEKAMKEIVQTRQEKRELLEQEASYIRRDIHRFQTEAAEIEAKIEAKMKINQEQTVTHQEPPEVSTPRWRVYPAGVIGMILLVIFAFILIKRPWNTLVGIVLILAEGIYIWNRMKEGRKRKTVTCKEPADDGNETQAYEHLVWQRERLLGERKEKEVAYENIQEQIEELELTGEEYRIQDKKRKALELAKECLQKQSLNVHKELGFDLDKRASRILKELTNEKYDRIFINQDLELSLYADHKRIPVERVSRGTLEQVYLAVRLSALEVLYTEPFPILLDDTFVFYDNLRVESTLCHFYRRPGQTLLFTCHFREHQILTALEIPFTHIRL